MWKKEDLNPEEEDLDKDAIWTEDDPTVFLNGCWMGITFIWYLVTQTLNNIASSTEKFWTLFCYLSSCYIKFNVLVKIDFWQDFVDFLIISKFSFPPILRTHSCYRYLQTLFLSLWITYSNELLHIEFCLCVISIFRIFVLIRTFWTLAAILVQNMKFF